METQNRQTQKKKAWTSITWQRGVYDYTMICVWSFVIVHAYICVWVLLSSVRVLAEISLYSLYQETKTPILVK